ncbi:hypothetical protein BJF83_22890 [Nocardiopsis sp. CNR-923]|uniref:WhiB family transcriptional regulator n=1 Tax=Nocardiopsis sp. CNR-923 TaxID=1904965 RepID=UPI000959ECB8|nr:WhiB family transcriptional regulator [Nocardiopsis sp. CNR-923]OLT25408.1 hypothetical protein BJF83_22890 [Nocardiopsis sp. CNR-923]
MTDSSLLGRLPCHHDPDALFVSGEAQRQATAVCAPCPIIRGCLAEALNDRIEFGVWGGMTERERRRLLKHHPHIDDWRQVFADHARRHAQQHPAPVTRCGGDAPPDRPPPHYTRPGLDRGRCRAPYPTRHPTPKEFECALASL